MSSSSYFYFFHTTLTFMEAKNLCQELVTREPEVAGSIFPAGGIFEDSKLH